MNELPKYCRDINIDNDTLLMLCENKEDASNLNDSIQHLDIDCNIQLPTPVMTVTITYNDLSVVQHEYNNIALIWKECNSITGWAIGVLGLSDETYCKYPLSV